jgi:hypothetical protein
MDKKIISLWLNGRSIQDIADIVHNTTDYVNRVINQKIFYEEG